MYRAKNYKSAIAYYEKALTLDPNYFQAIFNLGLAQYYLKNYDESISHFRKIITGNYENFEKKCISEPWRYFVSTKKLSIIKRSIY